MTGQNLMRFRVGISQDLRRLSNLWGGSRNSAVRARVLCYPVARAHSPGVIRPGETNLYERKQSVSQACDILDINLADEGQKRILWADRDMPVLARIRERFAEERPLEGVRIGACMHVTTETANLMRTLVASGAEVTLCASNPLSTQDDTAASLVRDYGVRVYAIAGEDAETYERHIAEVVATNPQIIMDDGADLDTALHTKFPEKLEGVIGGTEETTTGVVRLMAMAKRAALPGVQHQRRQHQALLRQPLRHRPVHLGRHRARHEPPFMRAHHGGVRLWLLRERPGPAREGHGHGRHRVRGGSSEGA